MKMADSTRAGNTAFKQRNAEVCPKDTNGKSIKTVKNA